MKFTDQALRELALEYSAARVYQIRIDAKVRELAEEGDHKRKQKVIYTEGVKASVRVNTALRALTDWLDKSAIEGIRRADEAQAEKEAAQQ